MRFLNIAVHNLCCNVNMKRRVFQNTNSTSTPFWSWYKKLRGGCEKAGNCTNHVLPIRTILDICRMTCPRDNHRWQECVLAPLRLDRFLFGIEMTRDWRFKQMGREYLCKKKERALLLPLNQHSNFVRIWLFTIPKFDVSTNVPYSFTYYYLSGPTYLPPS